MKRSWRSAALRVTYGTPHEDLVTEKTAPFLHYPVQTLRQTDEGGVMMGDSQEEAGADPNSGLGSVLPGADTRVCPRPCVCRE